MALTHGVYTVVMVNAAKKMRQRHLQELRSRGTIFVSMQLFKEYARSATTNSDNTRNM